MANKYDVFSAPVPGESLTLQKGSTKMEQPPQFTKPNEAAEYVWAKITEPRQAERIVAMLTKGLSCEFITRTMLFTGFQEGKWTVDVALLMARPVLYMVAAIGTRAKVKNLKIMNPDKEQDNFLKNLGFTKKQEKAIEADIKEEMKSPSAFGGILGAGMNKPEGTM